MRSRRQLAFRAALPAGIVAVLAAAPAARADGFGCEASALRVSVLGARTVEPVTANRGASACADRTSGLTGQAAGLPIPLTAGPVVATTSLTGPKDRVDRQQVLSAAGVGDLRLASLPTLPLRLPPVTVPDALKSVHVDLSALDAALAAAGGDLTSIIGQVGGVTGGVTGATGGGGPLCGVGVCLRAAGPLPSSIDLDLTQAVQGLLPSGLLPSLDLLGIRGATAYAGGRCVDGKPFLDGGSKVSGLSVLGQDLPVGAAVDKVVSLIDAASIDPTQADLSKIQLPAALSSLGITLDNTPLLRSAVQQALAALGNLQVLAPTLAQIKVTPGAKTRTADAVTQQGLVVDVTVAGQSLLHAVLGDARASATGVRCTRSAPITATSVTLQCTKRRLVLVDVLERGDRVKLLGVADPQLAGKTVSIVFGATGRVVGHARVSRSGSFQTTAPLPPSRLRGTNSARYQARVGHERSLSLKLRRRMVLDSIRSRAGRVTITGRVVPPLGAPTRTITLERRVSCRRTEVVKRFRPAADGSFRVTVPAPKGQGAAVYRLQTSVRKTARNPKLYPTFTLPRAVTLQPN